MPVSPLVTETQFVVCTNPPDGKRTRIAALNVTATRGGAFTASLEESENGSALLAPGDSVTIDVRYAAPAPGADQGTLSVVENVDQPVLAILLSGSGVALEPCDFSWSPGTLDFGPVLVGERSKPTTVSFQNLGATACVVDAVAIRDDATSAFHILSTSLEPDSSAPAIVVAPPAEGGSAFTITLDFAPTTGVSPLQAQLGLSLVDPDGPDRRISLPLTGSVPPPDLSHCLVASPDALDLDGAEPGSGPICTSGTRMLTLSNQCDTDVTVQSIEIESPPEVTVPQFVILDPPSLPLTLKAGGLPLELELEFEPTQPGPAAATLDILCGPPGTADLAFALSGEIIPPGTETDTFTATGATSYALADHPEHGPAGMSVTIDQTPVPSLAGTDAPGWTYDAGANVVTFTSRVDLRVGQAIAVTYPIGCK